MALSTDFKDDILNESVNEKRKYQMTYNDDGTASFTDVTSYSQTGSQYGAKEVIEEREAINQLQEDVSSLNSDLGRGIETFNNITIDGTPYSGESTCYTFVIPSVGMQFARIFTTENEDLWGAYVDGGKLIYRHQSSKGVWLPWRTM